MARISYVEEEGHPELAAVVGKIKAGRRGALLNIYRLLLHAPALAETWLDHVGAVRWKTSLSGRIREIAIIRIAYLNRIAYVQQHVPALALGEGMSEAECEALKDWRASKAFDPRERALLAYADAMTQGPEVPDDVFAELRRHFSEREILELTVLIGTYIMHNRVFNAVKVDLEPV